MVTAYFRTNDDGWAVFYQCGDHFKPVIVDLCPVVTFLYKSRVIIRVLYYQKEDANFEVEWFMSAPQEWMERHFPGGGHSRQFLGVDEPYPPFVSDREHTVLQSSVDAASEEGVGRDDDKGANH